MTSAPFETHRTFISVLFIFIRACGPWCDIQTLSVILTTVAGGIHECGGCLKGLVGYNFTLHDDLNMLFPTRGQKRGCSLDNVKHIHVQLW